MLLLFAMGGCGFTRYPGGVAEDGGLEKLASCMAGSFSSADQAARDSTYLDIRLRMAPIWPARVDGCWLYVEQAVAGHEDRPYRQRVYSLRQIEPNRFESRVYALDHPLRFAGAWKDAQPLAALSPDSLIPREGCSIFLQRRAGPIYVGSTEGEGCASDLRGAKYATSEVTITPWQLVSWDRGFDAQGRQVWGAEGGGYIFRKIEDWSSRLHWKGGDAGSPGGDRWGRKRL